MDIQITVAAHISPFWRLWGSLRVPVKAKTLALSFQVSDREIYMKSLDFALSEGFQELMGKIPTQLAPYLYEADPRIGIQKAPANRGQVETVQLDFMKDLHLGAEALNLKGQFPASPLFDPPGGVFLPYADQASTPWTRCGLCRTPLSQKDLVTWGGGAALWVCTKCLPGHSLQTVV